jgi:hypothetical protein
LRHLRLGVGLVSVCLEAGDPRLSRLGRGTRLLELARVHLLHHHLSGPQFVDGATQRLSRLSGLPGHATRLIRGGLSLGDLRRSLGLEAGDPCFTGLSRFLRLYPDLVCSEPGCGQVSLRRLGVALCGINVAPQPLDLLLCFSSRLLYGAPLLGDLGVLRLQIGLESGNPSLRGAATVFCPIGSGVGVRDQGQRDISPPVCL